MTLYESFKQCALSHNRQDAIVFYGRRITFGRLLSLVDRTAYGLKNDGVKKNDVVTLCVPNSPSAAIAFYAINKLGAIANLVHPFAKWESVKHSMKKTGSKLLVTFDMYMDEVDCDCKKYVSDSGYFMPAIKRTYFHIANRKNVVSIRTTHLKNCSIIRRFPKPKKTTVPRFFYRAAAVLANLR